jgi:hypothetical protein
LIGALAALAGSIITNVVALKRHSAGKAVHTAGVGPAADTSTSKTASSASPAAYLLAVVDRSHLRSWCRRSVS